MGVIDWSKESEGKYETYPAGTYKVEITGYELTTANNEKKTPQVRWFAEIKEPEKYAGKKIVDHTALTEKALWRLAELVKAAGLDLKALGKMEIGSASFKNVLDKVVRRQMYWLVEYDGKYKNNKVEDYSPVEGQEALMPVVDVADTNCPF